MEAIAIYKEGIEKKKLANCWDTIHKNGNVLNYIHNYNSPIKFKDNLLEQYYLLDIKIYNNNKELIDNYLNLLKKFNKGISWEINDEKLKINIDITKLRSVKERKINSFLIRYIGFIQLYDTNTNTNKIVETIINLRKNGANIMDSLLLGSLIDYNNKKNIINTTHTNYIHNTISGINISIPERISKKEYNERVKIRESNSLNSDEHLFHKYVFKNIKKNNNEGVILQNYLINKEYKKAIKYFKDEQKNK